MPRAPDSYEDPNVLAIPHSVGSKRPRLGNSHPPAIKATIEPKHLGLKYQALSAADRSNL